MRISSEIFRHVRSVMMDGVSGKRLGLFHVSDFSSACARKSFYSHLLIHRRNEEDLGNFGNVSSLFLGTAVHKMLEGGPLTEVTMKYDIEKDREGKVDENTPVIEAFPTIVGTCDAVVTLSDGSKCIVDYKTRFNNKYPLRAPMPEHVKQVNIYALMLKKTRGIEAKHGAIVYFDSSQKLEKINVFDFPIQPFEKTRAEMLVRYTQFKEAADTGKLPDRVEDANWLCDGYCPYAKRCFKEEALGMNDGELHV